jgi:ABC-type polysaccharide/polyol phosphate export permease
MRWSNIRALAYRDMKVLLTSKFRLVEIFYFPITTIIIWGFFSIYARGFSLEAGLMVLIVNIFWNFALLTQSSTNLLINEDVWSGSLKHVLLSGISEFEYLISRILSSTVTSLSILAIMFGMGFLWFGMETLAASLGALAFLSVITLVASIGLAIMVAALFIYAGREYGFLAWTFLQLFILFSAPFFAVTVYPEPIRTISTVMPYTRVFEATRSLTTTGVVDGGTLWIGLLIAIIYVIIAIPMYYYAFQRARRTGELVRME